MNLGYSAAERARDARILLSEALAVLEQDPSVPSEVLSLAGHLGPALDSLREAERASSEPDGKACVKSALSGLSQTLVLLQDLQLELPTVSTTTETLARTMGMLFPLTKLPTRPPPRDDEEVPLPLVPKAAAVPRELASGSQAGPAPPEERAPDPSTLDAAPARSEPPAAQDAHGAGPNDAPAAEQSMNHSPPSEGLRGSAERSAPPVTATRDASPSARPEASMPRDRVAMEVNLGANTESNFYVGFSGEVADGGVFLCTYDLLPLGTPVRALVTLPGHLAITVDGHVRFLRDPMDIDAGEPGMGVAFDELDAEARELVLRFVRHRSPLFYED